MKNIVRAFVIALTLTGAVASATSTSNNAIVAKPKPSSLPVPWCAPGVPDGCGIDK